VQQWLHHLRYEIGLKRPDLAALIRDCTQNVRSSPIWSPGLPQQQPIPWDAPAILTGGIYVPESKPTTLREAVKAFCLLPFEARTLASIMSAEPVNGTQFLVGGEIQFLIDRLDTE
jgi:hypothetical protein